MRRSVYKLLAPVVALAATLTLSTALADGNKNETRLRAQLTGAAIGNITPSGNADFRSDSRGRTRLNVEVEHVNLPQGTVLTVTLTHAGTTTTVGTFTLSVTGFAELELNSQDGQTVPAVQSGDMIAVMNGASFVLSGVF